MQFELASKSWKTLRLWIDAATRASRFLMLTTGAILPIAECVFVNLLTGSQSGRVYFLGALVVLGTVHIVLLAVQLWPPTNFPFQCIADAVELEQSVANLKIGLERKSNIHRALRTAIDALNLQTCQLNPLSAEAFAAGMHPIICSTITNAHTVLGVNSNWFTIELYCDRNVVLGATRCGAADGLEQLYFFSPISIDPCKPIRLGRRSPAAWAWQRKVSGTCRASDDPNVFYEAGHPPADSYFKSVCAVPVHYPCSREIQGILVLTANQDESFADDVIDTMQFVSSLITQYIAAHNRCVEEWQMRMSTRA
jgi:hypothetical protein